MTHTHTPPRPLGPLLDIPRCQRWRERKDSYRHIGDNFDPSLYAVDVVAVVWASGLHPASNNLTREPRL